MNAQTREGNGVNATGVAWAAFAAVSVALASWAHLLPGTLTGEPGPSVHLVRLAWGVAIWGVCRLTVGRSLGVVASGITLCLVCASLSGGAAFHQERRARSEALGRLQTDFKRMVQDTLDADGMPKTTELPMPAQAGATGEIGAVDSFTRQVFSEMIKLRNSYISDIEALGWGKVLDAQRLRADRDFSATRKMITAIRQLIDANESASEAALRSVPQKIAALNLSEKSKREMVRGYELASERGMSRLRVQWALERKVVDEIEGAAKLLHAQRARWAWRNNQYLFNDQSTLDAFNAHLAAVEKFTAQQRALQKESADNALAQIEKLKQ